jgi:type I restriction enzyme S subunit
MEINENRKGYKKTKVGWIPNTWSFDKLEVVCQKIQDGTHFSPNSAGIGEVMYITSKNIRPSGIDLSNVTYISKVEHEEIYRRCDVIRGDILLTKDGANTGNACINTLDNEFSLLSSVAFLRADPSQLYNYYLLYLIQGAYGQKMILDALAGQAITRITLSKLRGFKFAYPPLPEQRRIAEILSTWDEAIQKLDALIANKQELKKGLMQQLLTGQLRFPEFVPKGGTKFKETKLGLVPEDWEVVKMDQMGRVESGGTPDTSVDEYWNGNIDWYTPTDITSLSGSVYVSGSSRKISKVGMMKSSAKLLPKNSIIVCTRASVGQCAVLANEATTNQGFKNIISNDSSDSLFLYYWFSGNTKQLVRKAAGSTFLEVSTRDFKVLDVLKPCKLEQLKIGESLFSLDQSLMKVTELRSTILLQKLGLMQQLLTGAVRTMANN